MKLKLVCLYDEVDQSWTGSPLRTVRSIRQFCREVLDVYKVNKNLNPSEFSAWYLGDFDDETGEFTILEHRKRIDLLQVRASRELEDGDSETV